MIVIMKPRICQCCGGKIKAGRSSGKDGWVVAGTNPNMCMDCAGFDWAVETEAVGLEPMPAAEKADPQPDATDHDLDFYHRVA